METLYFNFEQDFVSNMRCVPMIVRYKLDRVDLKLQLGEWNRLGKADKAVFAKKPCETPAELTTYRDFVKKSVWDSCQKVVKDLGGVDVSWERLDTLPDEVLQKATEWQCVPPTLAQWRSLDLLQRFALVKLSRSGHEGENFPKAIAEFFG